MPKAEEDLPRGDTHTPAREDTALPLERSTSPQLEREPSGHHMQRGAPLLLIQLNLTPQGEEGSLHTTTRETQKSLQLQIGP